MNDQKIADTHRQRIGCIYVRQSTMHQARHNKESQTRQYALHECARQLGFSNVVVIDDDLGRSGSGQVDRPGFGRLLSMVCEGTVGAVFALEASRLARNNREWHHLLDLCAMTGTLVIDENGVYDPRLLNDRLLLGLQGTMSEFELGLFQQRSREALLAMIRRGLAPWMPPTGYVRTETLGIEMTPDRQVQQAIRGVFTKFQQTASARQVLLWYVQNDLLLPRLKPSAQGWDIVWQRPTYSRIINLLRNPAYAGTFVYGRRPTRFIVKEGKSRKSHGYDAPLEQWKVVIHNHHPGYITWAEFLRIRAQLQANRMMEGHESHGAAKEGSALLAGLLRCARCGRKLHVSYGGQGSLVGRYSCKGGAINHGVGHCISAGALRIDRAVVHEVLEALQPAGIEASLLALEQAEQAGDQQRTSIELALEKARYEVERARRQYDAVDPQNRLVAGELEKRWNAAIIRVTEIEFRLAELSRSQLTLTQGDHQRVLALGQDLEAVWNHPAAPASLKKRVLRTVLEEIVVDVADEPPQIHLRLHWAGGVHTEVRVVKNRSGQHRRCAHGDVLELVRELAKVSTDSAMASILNRLGYETGTGNSWTSHRVADFRNYHGIPVCNPESRNNWCTLNEAAGELHISHPTVFRLIEQKILPAKQVVRHAPWVILRESLQLPAVQDAVHAVQKGRCRPRSSLGQRELPLK